MDRTEQIVDLANGEGNIDRSSLSADSDQATTRRARRASTRSASRAAAPYLAQPDPIIRATLEKGRSKRSQRRKTKP